MAIPGSTAVQEYGIRLGIGELLEDNFGNVIPSRTQVQRTIGGATAPSTSGWTVIVELVGGSTSYTDVLTNDGKRRWYRIRHALSGYEASTWLGTVDATPVWLAV